MLGLFSVPDLLKTHFYLLALREEGRKERDENILLATDFSKIHKKPLIVQKTLKKLHSRANC